MSAGSLVQWLIMVYGPDSEGSFNPASEYCDLPAYNHTWDRDLNVYTIQEVPVLPADGDPGSEDLPIALKLLREFCLEAASSYAWEVWFNFAPEGDGESFEACWNPPSKGTLSIRLPRSLFIQGEDDLGVFGTLLRTISDHGIFAIHASEFRDAPPARHKPFDERGRLVPPPEKPPAEEPDTPGLVETVTIHAFRLSLKGHTVPDDLVIQICPRFWHMPTGFEVG